MRATPSFRLTTRGSVSARIKSPSRDNRTSNATVGAKSAQAAVARQLKPPHPETQAQQAKRREIGKLNQVSEAYEQTAADKHDQKNQQWQNGADRQPLAGRWCEIQQPFAGAQHLAIPFSSPML